MGTQSAPLTVTVANTGNASFGMSGIVMSGQTSQFTISTDNCAPYPRTIPAGGSCTFDVQFAPTSGGPHSAVATVTSDAAGGDSVASLSGVGVEPVVSFSPASLSFDGQIAGTVSAAQKLTIQNTGSTNLDLSSIATAGANSADFTIESNTCFPLPKVLAPSQQCTLDVRFAPSATGARSASVRVLSNDTSGQDDAPLDGTGTQPVMTFDPQGVTFADQLLGVTSPAKTIAVANSGSGELLLGSFNLTGPEAGDFSLIEDDCLPLPRILSAGQQCLLVVKFRPIAVGTRTAGVHVVNNVGSGDASIVGTGAAPPPEPQPAEETAFEPLAPQTAAAPAKRCRVPRLKGKTVAAAKTALRRAGCALGKVKKVQSKTRPGRVLRQGKRAGRSLPHGTRVALVVSRR